MAHLALILLLAAGQFGQTRTGELRLTVRDAGGLPVQSSVALVSEANQIAETLETASDGTIVARPLPFGRYRIEVTRPGFETYTALIDIQSVLPSEHTIVLRLAALEAQVTVSADDTLLDVRQSSTVNRIGADTLQRRVTALPGRAISDVVNTQPGWLLEANGVLHPRGSEYQVQFVVDGLPITDNRSASFAPEFDADQVRAISTLTAGYPAEYGRKLGGVVELASATDQRQGFHGSVVPSAGRFATGAAYGMGQYGWSHGLIGVSGDVTRTGRYLDPPVEENFTNHGTGSNATVHIEHEFSSADRVGAIVRRGGVRFLVPNEREQEDAGQRQARTSTESAVQLCTSASSRAASWTCEGCIEDCVPVCPRTRPPPRSRRSRIAGFERGT